MNNREYLIRTHGPGLYVHAALVDSLKHLHGGRVFSDPTITNTEYWYVVTHKPVRRARWKRMMIRTKKQIQTG